ncbi:hypothetical protein HK405_015245, partial [Cladochytrium tenue]
MDPSVARAALVVKQHQPSSAAYDETPARRASGAGLAPPQPIDAVAFRSSVAAMIQSVTDIQFELVGAVIKLADRRLEEISASRRELADSLLHPPPPPCNAPRSLTASTTTIAATSASTLLAASPHSMHFHTSTKSLRRQHDLENGDVYTPVLRPASASTHRALTAAATATSRHTTTTSKNLVSVTPPPRGTSATSSTARLAVREEHSQPRHVDAVVEAAVPRPTPPPPLVLLNLKTDSRSSSALARPAAVSASRPSSSAVDLRPAVAATVSTSTKPLAGRRRSSAESLTLGSYPAEDTWSRPYPEFANNATKGTASAEVTRRPRPPLAASRPSSAAYLMPVVDDFAPTKAVAVTASASQLNPELHPAMSGAKPLAISGPLVSGNAVVVPSQVRRRPPSPKRSVSRRRRRPTNTGHTAMAATVFSSDSHLAVPWSRRESVADTIAVVTAAAAASSDGDDDNDTPPLPLSPQLAPLDVTHSDPDFRHFSRQRSPLSQPSQAGPHSLMFIVQAHDGEQETRRSGHFNFGREGVVAPIDAAQQNFVMHHGSRLPLPAMSVGRHDNADSPEDAGNSMESLSYDHLYGDVTTESLATSSLSLSVGSESGLATGAPHVKHPSSPARHKPGKQQKIRIRAPRLPREQVASDTEQSASGTFSNQPIAEPLRPGSAGPAPVEFSSLNPVQEMALCGGRGTLSNRASRMGSPKPSGTPVAEPPSPTPYVASFERDLPQMGSPDFEPLFSASLNQSRPQSESSPPEIVVADNSFENSHWQRPASARFQAIVDSLFYAIPVDSPDAAPDASRPRCRFLALGDVDVNSQYERLQRVAPASARSARLSQRLLRSAVWPAAVKGDFLCGAPDPAPSSQPAPPPKLTEALVTVAGVDTDGQRKDPHSPLQITVPAPLRTCSRPTSALPSTRLRPHTASVTAKVAVADFTLPERPMSAAVSAAGSVPRPAAPGSRRGASAGADTKPKPHTTPRPRTAASTSASSRTVLHLVLLDSQASPFPNRLRTSPSRPSTAAPRQVAAKATCLNQPTTHRPPSTGRRPARAALSVPCVCVSDAIPAAHPCPPHAAVADLAIFTPAPSDQPQPQDPEDFAPVCIPRPASTTTDGHRRRRSSPSPASPVPFVPHALALEPVFPELPARARSRSPRPPSASSPTGLVLIDEPHLTARDLLLSPAAPARDEPSTQSPPTPSPRRTRHLHRRRRSRRRRHSRSPDTHTGPAHTTAPDKLIDEWQADPPSLTPLRHRSSFQETPQSAVAASVPVQPTDNDASTPPLFVPFDYSARGGCPAEPETPPDLSDLDDNDQDAVGVDGGGLGQLPNANGWVKVAEVALARVFLLVRTVQR